MKKYTGIKEVDKLISKIEYSVNSFIKKYGCRDGGYYDFQDNEFLFRIECKEYRIEIKVNVENVNG